MSSSSRLVLEVRSHIIMSGNFTLLLGFSYTFSAKKKLKTWCVSGVGKSAFYSKQKERHSKGERVPFSAYTNFYTNF